MAVHLSGYFTNLITLRLAVALVGIALAGVVMFIQLGLRDGLFDSSVTIHRRLAGDLVMISPRTTSSLPLLL